MTEKPVSPEFGVLSLISVDVSVNPYQNAYDWGFERYTDQATAVFKKKPSTRNFKRVQTQLKSGDLVKVFKTVSDGDVFWEGRIKFYQDGGEHYQTRLRPETWSRMFYDQLPARMERNGQVIFGALNSAGYESGSEHDDWRIREYGKSGNEGLHNLENGDKLTVYKMVRDGEVDWEERVLDFGPVQLEKTRVHSILRRPNHMDTERWFDMMWQHRPVIITPK